jgi:hypothetical protein
MRLKVGTKIAERDLPDLFVADHLQVYCRFFSGYLQSTYATFLRPFHSISAVLKKRASVGRADRRIDRWTDGWMDRPSYRDACTHLIMCRLVNIGGPYLDNENFINQNQN